MPADICRLRNGAEITLGTILKVGDEGHGQWRAIYEVINFRHSSKLEGSLRVELATLRLFRGQEVNSFTKKELDSLFSKEALQVHQKFTPKESIVSKFIKKILTFYKFHPRSRS